MGIDRTTSQPPGWMARNHRGIERGFAVLWVALLIPPLLALARNQGDGFHHEHSRLITLAGSGLVASLSTMVAGQQSRRLLMALSAVLLLVCVGLSR